MLSKKYKHGDVVVILSKDRYAKYGETDFVTIVELNKLVLNKDKESFRHCIFGLQAYHKIDDIVVFRTDMGSISWTEERKVMKATPAQQILFNRK